MGVAGADGGVAARARRALPLLVVPPALDRAALAQAAGVRAPGADGGEFVGWGVGLCGFGVLCVVVGLPLRDGARLSGAWWGVAGRGWVAGLLLLRGGAGCGSGGRGRVVACASASEGDQREREERQRQEKSFPPPPPARTFVLA